MIFGVPLALVATVAVYQLLQYGALKRLQASPLDAPIGDQTGFLAILGPLTALSRVFGWGFFIYYAYVGGILRAIVLVLFAFPLSLALQWLPQRLLRIDVAVFVNVLALVSLLLIPVCAIAMVILVR